MGPLGQPQRGVRAATGNAADMWGGAVSEAQRALERGRELGRVRGRKRACTAGAGADVWPRAARTTRAHDAG